MQVTEPNCYQNSKIYKIVSSQTDQVYIGSTYNPLSVRMSGHRSAHRNYREGKNYCTSFEILKYDDAVIVLVENYPCNSSYELLARETYWMRQFQNIVNARAGIGSSHEDILAYQMRRYEELKNNLWTCALCGISTHPMNRKQHEKTRKHQRASDLEIDRIFS